MSQKAHTDGLFQHKPSHVPLNNYIDLVHDVHWLGEEPQERHGNWQGMHLPNTNISLLLHDRHVSLLIQVQHFESHLTQKLVSKSL